MINFYIQQTSLSAKRSFFHEKTIVLCQISFGGQMFFIVGFFFVVYDADF